MQAQNTDTGDSHAKKISAELRVLLDYNYDIMGVAKPDAKMSDILTTARDEAASLTNKDILIIWAGANDISKNNTKEALKCLIKFMEGNIKTNIILIHALHRHDLTTSSCVNKEVLKFNRQMKKIIKLNAKVKLMEIDLQRQHFTRHGQHLNLVGKELVASELAKVINQLLTKSEINPIQRQWKEEFLHEINISLQNENEKLVSNKVLPCEGYCCKLCPSNDPIRKNHRIKIR
jgi:hypothetical protein